jgi:hypothetical protein
MILAMVPKVAADLQKVAAALGALASMCLQVLRMDLQVPGATGVRVSRPL